MNSLRNQNTIGKSVAVTGFGYWSGLDVSVEFFPAPANHGIRFVRCDLPGQPDLPARIVHRSHSPRRTTICRDGVSVEMIEHIMAALYGLQIDNCKIVVNQSEMPCFDGSSQAFVTALLKAGTQPLDQPRSQLVVNESLRIGDDEHCWIQIEPCDHLKITYHLNYANQPQIGKQEFEITIDPDTFVNELGDARTFLLKHEADWLLQQGLGQRVSYQNVLVYGEDGPIDNRLRYSNECVRHKILDVVGDFALSGYEVCGHITASRTGHRLNGELTRRLLKHGQIIDQHAPQFISSLKSA
ncbi:MAG: UDP-3-O-acyl-N-acetylglucosamine deacetylase [Pirellulaceae bacterium]|nr:UDP-3-O-acyl-N-acetylglucosamine deacetylase [Pirellulaceae bacterium]